MARCYPKERLDNGIGREDVIFMASLAHWRGAVPKGKGRRFDSYTSPPEEMLVLCDTKVIC